MQLYSKYAVPRSRSDIPCLITLTLGRLGDQLEAGDPELGYNAQAQGRAPEPAEGGNKAFLRAVGL